MFIPYKVIAHHNFKKDHCLSNSAFIHPESVFAAGTAMGDLFQVVNAVRDQTAAQPEAEHAADEGPQMLDETGVSLDGRGHLLVTPRTHQGHGARAKIQALSERSYIIGGFFIQTVVTL